MTCRNSTNIVKQYGGGNRLILFLHCTSRLVNALFCFHLWRWHFATVIAVLWPVLQTPDVSQPFSFRINWQYLVWLNVQPSSLLSFDKVDSDTSFRVNVLRPFVSLHVWLPCPFQSSCSLFEACLPLKSCTLVSCSIRIQYHLSHILPE